MLRNIIILRVNNKMPLRYVVIISHQYYKNGSISNEIVSLNIKGHLFDKDESIKPTLTEQRLNRLRPLLANGTVTVGNSCMK